MHNVYMAISIITELIATSFIKTTDGFTKLWPSILVIASYAICFYCFSKALFNINLSFAYALWSGLGIIVSTLVSIFIYKEGISAAGIAGIILILAGVVIINLAGTSSH